MKTKKKQKKHIKQFATLNVQGLNGAAKQKLLADDFLHNKFTFMMLQETKIQKNVQINIESSNGQKLTLYNSGHNSRSWKGVGIRVRENTKISFEAASERIYIAEIKLDNNIKVFAISAYAATEDETEKHPERTEQFYNKLTTVVNKCSMRYILIVGRDLSARTKLSNETEIEQCQNILGTYAHNNINSNGRNLIEFCKMHNVKLTNTFYKHKLSQQVT